MTDRQPFFSRRFWRYVKPDGSFPVIDDALGRWGRALRLLKKQYRSMRGLRKASWYVMLGPRNSGKTTLLAHSGLVLESSDDMSIRPILPTDSVNYWVGKRVLIADIGGRWSDAEEGSPAEHAWKTMLYRWRSFRSKSAYLGVLLVLDCELIQSHDKSAWRDYINKVSLESECVLSVFPQARFTILLSKADKLLGFEAFFAMLTVDERQQLCGVHLQTGPNQKPFESISLALKTLLHRIDLLTVSRLHYEQDILKRDLLRAFPQRFGMFIDELVALLEALPGSVQRQISGIYLTSSEQPDEQSDDPLSESHDLSSFVKPISTPYFVKELFAELIKPEAHHRGAANRWHWTMYHLVIGSAVIIAALFWLHRGFVETRAAIQEAQTILTKPIPMMTRKGDWLSHLNDLVHVKKVLSNHEILRYRWLGFTVDGDLLKSVDARYREGLMKQLAPDLTATFEHVLQNDLQQGAVSSSLYHDLEGYLRWIHAGQSNPARLMPVILSLWRQAKVPEAKQQALLLHLHAYLRLHPSLLPVNHHLVREARSLLLSLPKEVVAWQWILSKALNTNNSSTQTLGNSVRLLKVQSLYLPKHAKQLRTSLIPEAIKALSLSSDVLNKPIFSLTENSYSMVVQAVYDQYLQGMSRYWYEQLRSIVLTPVVNFDVARMQLHDLADIESTFWRWIARLLDILDESHEPLPHKAFWGQLHAFTVAGKQQSAFRLAGERLDTLLSSCDSLEATFQKTVDRMQHPSPKESITVMRTLATMMPNPIKDWLQTLTQSIWVLMVDQTAEWINKHWEDEVYPFYERHIESRFPINPGADDAIRISDFTTFFGPGGTMQRFFEQYLDPFFDTNAHAWTVKKVDGIGLPLSQENVEMIFKSSVIQKMFYQDNRQIPTVLFSLMPTHIPSELQSISLSVGGKVVEIDAKQVSPISYEWPGIDGGTASITWVNPQTGESKLIKAGPWSWFRLLKAANLAMSSQANQYNVTWSLDGQALSFQLLANHVINPYLPHVLSDFNLSSPLLSSSN